MSIVRTLNKKWSCIPVEIPDIIRPHPTSHLMKTLRFERDTADRLTVHCNLPAHFSHTTLHDYSDPEHSFCYGFETIKTRILKF
jgi:hypothetical protein